MNEIILDLGKGEPFTETQIGVVKKLVNEMFRQGVIYGTKTALTMIAKQGEQALKSMEENWDLEIEFSHLHLANMPDMD